MKDMKKLLCTDLLCRKYDHYNVNHRYLKFFQEHFETYFAAYDDHCERMSDLQVKKNRFFSAKLHPKVENVFICFQVFFLIMQYRPDIVVVLSSNSLQQLIFKLINYILRLDVFFVLHGELNNLIYDPKGVFSVHRILPHFNTKKITYICNAEYIHLELVKLLPSLKNNVVTIQLPYTRQYEILKEFKNNQIFTVSSFGLFSKEKGSHQFLKLAEMVKHECPDVSFNHIGRAQYSSDLLYNFTQLDRTPNELGYTIAEYVSELKSCNLVVLTYPPSFLYLGTSAVAMDAYLHEKVLLALDNVSLSSLKEITGGYGTFFPNLGELAIAIIEKYREWKADGEQEKRVHYLYDQYELKVEKDLKCAFL